jgi:hypothetical protein
LVLPGDGLLLKVCVDHVGQLADLVREVHRVEAAGLGRLGTDDLFIRISNVTPKFHFCNDSDIHIRFEEPDQISEFFQLRWKLCGYHPAEWTTLAKGSRERIRIDMESFGR